MKPIVYLALTCVIVTVAQPANAQVPAAKAIVKAIAKYLGKEVGQEASEQAVKKMTKEVGEALIERTAEKILREGSEKSLVELSEMVAKHGPDVIRAVDNVPDALPVLRLLKEVPADEFSKAASRLAAGNTGKELATLSTKIGVSALRAEAKHPGVGIIFAKSLGKEGVDLSLKLTSDQAIQIGRHANDIAQLPLPQRTQLLSLISNNADRFASFVGRFVEKNPGKVLLTAAGTSLILAESERVLGGGELFIDEDGKPHWVEKPGLIDRTVGKPIAWTLYLAGGVVVLALFLFAASKVWKHNTIDRMTVKNYSDAEETTDNG